MQGRNYIHVRRKVNGKQKQHFVNIDKMSKKEIELEKKKAKKLDNAWKNEQSCNDQSLISFFSKEGKLKHILISPPQPRTDWSVKSIINNRNKCLFSVSRSIPKYGFDKAVEEVVEKLLDFFEVPKDSITRMVLLALYRNSLKEELREKYFANRSNVIFQSQLPQDALELTN